MRKKVLVRAPVLTRSGYGEHGRFVVRALRSKPELFEIYVIPVNWGETGWLTEDNEERIWLDERIKETATYGEQGGQFDISIQVTIPNEWQGMAPINIGVTAGIETTKVAPVWLEKANMMDKIITISEHSKQSFVNTVYEGMNSQTRQPMILKCEKEVNIVHYPVKTFDNLPELKLNLDYDFNYLAMAQAGPRKNLENMIRWFTEENAQKEVGLVLKTSIKNNSITDRQFTEAKLKSIIAEHGDIKCKIYLLHGDLTEEELAGLYQDKKIKCLISTTHGEGYGLPLFEAAYNGLPVVCVGWSGQRDFLYVPQKNGKNKAMFGEIEYDLRNVQPDRVWNGVIEKESQWAYPEEVSFKKLLREVKTDNAKFRRRASKLKKHLRENFTEEKMYKQFCENIYNPSQEELEWLEELSSIEIL